MRFTAVLQGEQIDVELNLNVAGIVEAEIGGRKYALEAKMVEPGVYWFNWNNQSVEIRVTPNGHEYVVSLPHRRVVVEMTDAPSVLRRARQHGLEGVAEIRAPMPGKIVKLLVGEGAEVRANQGLLVVEAMKMQNEVKSPKGGTVRKLAVKEGDAVGSGDLLATVE